MPIGLRDFAVPGVRGVDRRQVVGITFDWANRIEHSLGSDNWSGTAAAKSYGLPSCWQRYLDAMKEFIARPNCGAKWQAKITVRHLALGCHEIQ